MTPTECCPSPFGEAPNARFRRADPPSSTDAPDRGGGRESGGAGGSDDLPVAVIGAGPVGLAAAAHLAARDREAVVLEAGAGPGTSVREWSHVRLFSPWELCIDPVAREMLDAAGWEAPPADELPTGRDLVEEYLEPLAELPELRFRIRYEHRVTGVSRVGRDRLKGASRAERDDAPFLVRYENRGRRDRLSARAVIDASGTWTRPRPLGADGLPARGEREAAERIHYGLPDVLDAERELYAGERTAVVGAGHSAANVLLDLVRLKREEPGTEPLWVLRGGPPGNVFRDEEDEVDELEARGELERRLRELVEKGPVRMIAEFGTRAVRSGPDGITLEDGRGRSLEADRVVGVTGFRPDLGMLRELRLDLDPATESPRDLGPLIDPNVHSCGTVPPHGEEELRHPEPGFYVVGMKSYGRAPTFLLPTGYEQVRSVVAALAGDREAARRTELDLPETGVCSADAALAADGDASPAPAATDGREVRRG